LATAGITINHNNLGRWKGCGRQVVSYALHLGFDVAKGCGCRLHGQQLKANGGGQSGNRRCNCGASSLSSSSRSCSSAYDSGIQGGERGSQQEEKLCEPPIQTGSWDRNGPNEFASNVLVNGVECRNYAVELGWCTPATRLDGLFDGLELGNVLIGERTVSVDISRILDSLHMGVDVDEPAVKPIGEGNVWVRDCELVRHECGSILDSFEVIINPLEVASE
jgi:hypothetical protein